MLLVAVALAALVGFVFAAPGATVIYSNYADGRGISREQNGKISVAGPRGQSPALYTLCALLILGSEVYQFQLAE